jgi:hypothetical protein
MLFYIFYFIAFCLVVTLPANIAAPIAPTICGSGGTVNLTPVFSPSNSHRHRFNAAPPAKTALSLIPTLRAIVDMRVAAA